LAFRRRAEPGGFSLIELLIVLGVMGLMGAFALPSVLKMANRTTFSLNRQDLERQLDQLPQAAQRKGINLVLSSTAAEDDVDPPPVPAGRDPYPVKIPAGWRITVDAPILYRYDGTCSGGRLRIIAPDAEANYRMEPPLCELRPDRAS
jgi:prepilin-type N-terminal cleavage/methylation domain-containing protein